MSFESGPYVQGKSQPLRLYHFVGPDHWEDNLRQSHLKLAEVSNLNDSFDLLTPATDKRSERDKSRWFVESIGDLFGLICMSRIWSSPLMWAHYAGRHQGICIGFDVDPNRFSEVTYVKERPTLNYFGCQSFDDLGHKQLIKMGQIKFNAWEYEREYRHFVYKRATIQNDNSLFFQPFCDWLWPREIIIGERSTVSQEQILSALSKKYHGINIRKARSAFKSFKMTPRQDWDGS